MNNNSGIPNLSQNQLDAMLKMAGSRLGVSPEALKQQLQSGKLPQGVSNTMVSQYLSDPKKLESLLSSPQARQFLQNMMNNKGR